MVRVAAPCYGTTSQLLQLCYSQNPRQNARSTRSKLPENIVTQLRAGSVTALLRFRNAIFRQPGQPFPHFWELEPKGNGRPA